MQEHHLFEYAVIRVVPRVEREEFLNVGVIVYCNGRKFLKSIFKIDEKRISCFSPDLDVAELLQNLQAFERITAGEKDSGPIACLDSASRFRWLTATRSTVLQTSKVHPGFCKEPEETLKKLYSDLVL